MEPSTTMVGRAIPEPGVTDQKEGRTLGRPPSLNRPVGLETDRSYERPHRLVGSSCLRRSCGRSSSKPRRPRPSGFPQPPSPGSSAPADNRLPGYSDANYVTTARPCTPSRCDQYIPPMPPPPGIGGIFSLSFFSTTTHSVVRSSPAIDAAFCSAVRVTLVGSMTPAATRSSYSSVWAL